MKEMLPRAGVRLALTVCGRIWSSALIPVYLASIDWVGELDHTRREWDTAEVKDIPLQSLPSC